MEDRYKGKATMIYFDLESRHGTLYKLEAVVIEGSIVPRGRHRPQNRRSKHPYKYFESNKVFLLGFSHVRERIVIAVPFVGEIPDIGNGNVHAFVFRTLDERRKASSILSSFGTPFSHSSSPTHELSGYISFAISSLNFS